MIRVVFDANVIVSGLPAATGPLADIIDHWRTGNIRLIVSEHIINEVGRAWQKPYWRSRFSVYQAERALVLLRTESEVTPITVPVSGVASHAEDDVVIATSLSGQAHFSSLATSLSSMFVASMM